MRTHSLLYPILSIALLVAALPACKGADEPKTAPDSTPAPVRPTDAVPKPIPVKAKAVMDAAWGARKLIKTVHAAVVVEADKDVVKAMEVCSDAIVGTEIQKLRGARVGRASLKLRNSKNVGPLWVQEFLAAEPENVEKVDRKSISNIVKVGDEEVVQYLKRLTAETGCLACHGPVEDIAPAAVAYLKENYPDDAAVNYSEGDMMGVVWAERVVAKESEPSKAPVAPTPAAPTPAAPASGDPTPAPE
jgi:hypothetical protein